MNFHVFLPTKFVSFVFNNSLQLFPVSVNIKNDVEKDMTLLFFSFQKPGQPCDFLPIKPSVAFGLPDLLTELFYIGMPVVRTDSRVVSRSVYGHVITKFSWMGRLPHFLSNGATPTRGAQLLSLWKLQLAFSPTQNNTKRNDSSIWFGREKKVLVGVLLFLGGSVRCLEKISRKKDMYVSCTASNTWRPTLLGSLRIDDFRMIPPLGHITVLRCHPVEIWIYDS